MIGLALFVLAGAGLGWLHFAMLRRTIAAYLRGERSAIAWYILRLSGSAAIWFALACIGGALVLAALGGFMIARALAVRRARAMEAV